MACPVRVGILALQGAFAEHKVCLGNALLQLQVTGELGNYSVDIVEVRRPSDLDGLDGIILPGGESTTMSKFLLREQFCDHLNTWMKGINSYRPFVWGTCAGLILLANTVEDTKINGQCTIGGIDVTATRNIFGRQRESFEAPLSLHDEMLLANDGSLRYHGVFIRAPGINSIDSEEVNILATLRQEEDVKIVAVRQGAAMATSFHPELTSDLRWHIYFIKETCKAKNICRERCSISQDNINTHVDGGQ